MFEWLFGNKKEEDKKKLKKLMDNLPPALDPEDIKREFGCYHANENPNICMCKPDCICFEGTCKNRILNHTRINGQLAYVHPPEDKCLMCNKELKDAFWKYVWKKKEGYMCRDTCGRDFHAIGYYLLERASKVLEEQGIKVVQTKEKFGIMMLYATPKNEIESKIIKTVQENWQGTYPEFDWYFT